MPTVARCDECKKLFELPEGQVTPEEVDRVQSAGILRVTKVYLCPGCRKEAQERGRAVVVSLPLPERPPAPPAPAPTPEAEEAPQEEPSG